MDESTTSLLDFSASSLLAGFIFGVIGLSILRYGRRKADNRLVVVGLVMMIYPYFTRGVWADWGVGLGLCVLGFYLKDH